MRIPEFALFIIAFSSISMAFAEQPKPLGHPERRPSADSPFQYRGDGSGRFPGADPVSEWDEASGKNILWRTPLKTYGCATPLLVDGKVIVVSNPDTVTCLDADTGKVLWERQEFDLVFNELADRPAAERKELRSKIVGILEAQVHHGFQKDEPWQKAMAGYDFQGDFSDWLKAVKDDRHPAVRDIVPRGTKMRDGHTASTWEFEFEHQPELAKLGIEVDTNQGRGYQRWTSMVFTPPLSDGKRIYVQLARDTWVAYDFNGKRLWSNTDGRTDKHPPTLKWSDDRPGVLHRGHLITTGAYDSYVVLDCATGKVVYKSEGKALSKNNGERGYRFIRLDLSPVGGKGYALVTRMGLRINDDWTLGKPYSHYPVGRSGGKSIFGNYGAVQSGELIVSGFGGYEAKTDAGLKVYTLELEGGAPRLTDQRHIAFNDPASHAGKGTLGRRGHKANVDWRGLVVGDRHVYLQGASHWVTVVDRKTWKVVNCFQIADHKCDATSEGIYAGRRAYLPTWTGRTAVIDDATGKLIGVNRTQPIISGGFTAKGGRLYARGIYAVYAIGKE